MADKDTDSNKVKDWRFLREMGGWVVAIIIVTVAVFGYIDNKADNRYLSREEAAAIRTRVEVLEREVKAQDTKIDQIIAQNGKILEKLGIINGRLSSR